jgi:hypothetical protein
MEWKSEYDNLRENIPVTYLINPASSFQISNRTQNWWSCRKSMNFKTKRNGGLRKVCEPFRMRVMKAG